MILQLGKPTSLILSFEPTALVACMWRCSSAFLRHLVCVCTAFGFGTQVRNIPLACIDSFFVAANAAEVCHVTLWQHLCLLATCSITQLTARIRVTSAYLQYPHTAGGTAAARHMPAAHTCGCMHACMRTRVPAHIQHPRAARMRSDGGFELSTCCAACFH